MAHMLATSFAPPTGSLRPQQGAGLLGASRRAGVPRRQCVWGRQRGASVQAALTLALPKLPKVGGGSKVRSVPR